jgi:hypothetical protein
MKQMLCVRVVRLPKGIEPRSYSYRMPKGIEPRSYSYRILFVSYA